jgi:hypothetical protein
MQKMSSDLLFGYKSGYHGRLSDSQGKRRRIVPPGKHFSCLTGICLTIGFIFITGIVNCQVSHIGQVERTYELPSVIGSVTGIASREDERGKFLFIFEGSSREIHKFSIDENSGDLGYQGSSPVEGGEITGPKGFAYALECASDVFYFLDFVTYQENGNYKKRGSIYRYDLINRDLTSVDVSTLNIDISKTPIHSLARQGDFLYISYDPGSLSTQTERVRHGIAALCVDDGVTVTATGNSGLVNRPKAWQNALEGHPGTVSHMPGPGKDKAGDGVEASLSLAPMSVDGTDYLWGTVGNDYIYVMDGHSGRAIFYFNRPGSKEYPFYNMMTFLDGNLWVAEKVAANSFSIHRTNVLSNLQEPYQGDKYYREMRMELTSRVNTSAGTPRGYVYHTFCHPCSTDITGNQGVVPNSVRVNDLTGVPGYTVEHLQLDPAGDPEARQHYTLVSYLTDLNPGVNEYKTELFIKYWTRSYRHFVYPHLAFRDGGPAETHYLEDDPVLYGIEADPASYEGFISRVRKAISDEYNIEPDMDNPYWAAVNILEYTVENYHYPVDEAGYYATYDFANYDYNSHPGNRKAAYSADDNYVDNITACSGTGAMIGGVLRYMGFPSLWLGTSKENALSEGYFGPGLNEVQVSNGHRYNKVWLGSFYGWQDIDATPRVPSGNAFSMKPKEMSQWEIMQKAFFKVSPARIIHNLQSEFWDKLHIPFRSVCESNVNSCGSTRYNLLGSYDYPVYFRLSSQTMQIRGMQFIENVDIEVDEAKNATVTWQKTGDWVQDEDSRLTIILEKQCLITENCYPGFNDAVVLASGVSCQQESIAVSLAQYEGGNYRLTVRKEDDKATGNDCIFQLKGTSTHAEVMHGEKPSRVYPNPTDGRIYFNFENVTRVVVYNLTGSISDILDGPFTGSIDLTNLSRGQYIVRFNTSRETITEKVLLY